MMTNSYTSSQYVKLIEDYIDEIIPQCNYENTIVFDAMKYSLSIGGKRIRPILTLEFCRVCGGDINDALPLALAIEMIHTYSLIHDDLPCMDNDDMRRGMPSCHIKFGESYALLAGDALLTLAFETIANSEFAKKNPTQAIKAVSVIANCSGANGMIGGQVVDLSSEGIQIPINTLKTMHELKTGKLIVAATQLGLIAATANETQMKAGTNFAKNLGLAFQVLDDILDVIGDDKIFGKAVGADEANNKITYVSLLGLEKSQQMATVLTDEAISNLNNFEGDTSFLKELAMKLLKRNK